VGRVIAVDPGSKRIGVAISDSARTLAFPRPSVVAGDAAVTEIAALVSAESADVVVVGRPLSLRGEAGAAVAAADELRGALVAALPGVAVVSVDERFTTTMATRALREAGHSSREQRDRVDSAAAVVLLQGYLDALAH
jgi:putative holliday junction resolvase